MMTPFLYPSDPVAQRTTYISNISVLESWFPLLYYSAYFSSNQFLCSRSPNLAQRLRQPGPQREAFNEALCVSFDWILSPYKVPCEMIIFKIDSPLLFFCEI